MSARGLSSCICQRFAWIDMHFMCILRTLVLPCSGNKWVRNCFGNSFFFFRDVFFFFLVGGGFGAVQAPFWENPGVKGRFVRVLGHLGVVLELSRLRSGETSGEMQVPSRFGHKKLLQKANCPVHFCFLCVFFYVDVCVFVIEYVVCVFFLLLFWFFIQCTSFLVFAIYLFNV